MSRRVFVHVGSPKSGTTFLQRVLWSHRETLEQRGLLLPGAAFFDHFRATLDVREVSDPRHDSSLRENAWRRLVDEAAAWDGDALISHELFAGATATQAERALELLDGTEVHVVLTARDLLRQVPAEWQEMLKHRSTLTFPEFVHAVRHHERTADWFWKVQDAAGVLERWGGRLPRSQVHVVTVPPQGSDPHELWNRFTGLLDLDTTGLDLSTGRSNESVRAPQAELLRLLNLELGDDRLSEPGAYPGMVKSLLAHQILAGRPGATFGLVGDDQLFACERSEKMARDLEGLDVHVVGDLTDLVPTPAGLGAPEISPDAAVSRESVLEESVAALAVTLERLDDESRRRRALRAEVDRQREELPVLRAAAAERDRLAQEVRQRPIRHVLIEQSHHRPALGRLRRWYWRMMDVAKRLRRLGPGTARR